MSKVHEHGAQTIADLRSILSHLNSAEGIEASRRFQPRPDDIIIASYPKSGTTWMQQIVHGLRTGGNMDFSDITEVVPWIEMAHVLDLDLTGLQVASPRAFKTHWTGDEAPRDARTLFVYRDPKSVAVSYYRFYAGWILDPDAIPFSQFVSEYFVHGTLRGTYWTHLKSWLARRQDRNVLCLSYEALKANLAREVRRIAAFLNLAPPPASLDLAIHQASRDFMIRHSDKFDEHLVAGKRNAAMGLPASRRPRKIHAAGPGATQSLLEPGVESLLNDIWVQDIERFLGYPDYDSLRRDLESSRAFG